VKRQLPVIPASPLPPLYAAWMDQLLAGPVPHERDATCDECAMLDRGDAPSQTKSALFFNPQTKCCSYIPAIPNYLVGRILADDDSNFARGRTTICEHLRAGVGVTPLGLEQPPGFQAIYGQSAESLFGRSRALRCPYYMEDGGGRCGIWRHRASVCATWYCKHERGEQGMRFWRALHQLLTAVEKSLARWCMLELEVGTDALSLLFPLTPSGNRAKGIDARALDGVADPVWVRKLWGDWAGREEAFYRQCADLVSALDWNEVANIGGTEVRIFERLLRDADGKLRSREIPERLKVGPVRIISMNRDSCCISTYSDFDPLDVPKRLMEVLGYFDGRPSGEAIAAIAAAEDIRIDETLVRKLTDFGVLVPV
jgi:hypothetical protein